MSESQPLSSTPSVERPLSAPILVKLLEQSEHAIRNKQDSDSRPAAAPTPRRPLATPKRLYTYD